MIKQISVFIENKPGSLADITGVLAKNNININAMNIAETSDYGLLRLIVEETDKTLKALNDEGYITHVSEVVKVQIPDEPGSLNGILKKLAAENINVKYMYSIFSLQDGKACLIFKVDDCEKAEKVLEED